MKKKTILSLGAGVQSSTLALMAAHGEVTPMPDCAIFSDTGAEPEAVYDWLDWLEKQLPFPVHRVSYRNLREDIGKQRPTGKFDMMPIPAWIKLKEGDRPGGLLRRQCTTDYKIRPLIKEVRKQLGIFGKKTPDKIMVSQWIGISLDEIQRMKNSREKFIEHRWPLVEKRITRLHCIEWMQKHYNRTPPRSACTFCPFHDDKEWRQLRDNNSEGWNDAVRVDEMIRALWKGQDSQAEFYLHRSHKPLSEADLTDYEAGQHDLFGFENECEGMCGV
jgi:hypothetical protein